MSKKLGVAALACVGLLGFGAMHAQAQIPTYSIQSQTFPFSGTCNGGNMIIGTPNIILSDAAGNLVKSATITASNITIFQAPTGLQYAYLSVSGGPSTDLVWVGPSGGSVTTTLGSSNTTATTTGNGVYLPFGGGLNLTLSCASGSWQAFATIWYHAP
jgi:hypothetical protein